MGFLQLSSLPSPVTETNNDAKRIESSEELKIAWRYENLSMDASNNTRCGNSYDLSTPYTLTEEHKAKIATWDGPQSTSSVNSKQLKGISSHIPLPSPLKKKKNEIIIFGK